MKVLKTEVFTSYTQISKVLITSVAFSACFSLIFIPFLKPLKISKNYSLSRRIHRRSSEDVFFSKPLFTQKENLNLKTYNSTLLDIYRISVGEKLKKKHQKKRKYNNP